MSVTLWLGYGRVVEQTKSESAFCRTVYFIGRSCDIWQLSTIDKYKAQAQCSGRFIEKLMLTLPVFHRAFEQIRK